MLHAWTSSGITSSTTYNLFTQMKEGNISTNMMKHDLIMISGKNTTKVTLLSINKCLSNHHLINFFLFCNPCFKVV